jgi:predicted phosphoribosyltransferase
LRQVQDLADDTVCLLAPQDFMAVGQYYRDFAQVDDAQVLALLAGQTRWS